ncbi:MAG TPA: nickel pincer cofactor biosynthesis protein LarC [Acidimicrobiales bacterium]|nr:nickel pincer cofactor biosynthesis protein LarC [Acidimicrobiales bacterium]
MTTVAWFHCFSGIAGDMALGALVDAGADLDEVRALVERLPVTDWELDVEPVLRCGIAATQVHVRATDHAVVRTAAHITGLVEEARLPTPVAERALATFRALAEVEGRLHRRPPEQVHFHEVGGIDAIVDVVGTCAALHVLGVDEVRASAVAHGTGMIRAAHGLLPNPPPAVVELLRGAPTYGVDLPLELTTPTGAALLAANVTGWGPLPAMRIEVSGFGAGARELHGRPNAVQVVLGEAMPEGDDVGLARPGQPVVLLEANVDDATGEILAHTVQALLEAGAHDAWVTPVVMKKGRPAHVVSALVDPALAEQVGRTLASETGSLGFRGATLERWPSTRLLRTVEVEGLPVRVKVSPGRLKVEHDDAAWVARRRGLPLREVLSRAEAEARGDTDPPEPPSTPA